MQYVQIKYGKKVIIMYQIDAIENRKDVKKWFLPVCRRCCKGSCI